MECYSKSSTETLRSPKSARDSERKEGRQKEFIFPCHHSHTNKFKQFKDFSKWVLKLSGIACNLKTIKRKVRKKALTPVSKLIKSLSKVNKRPTSEEICLWPRKLSCNINITSIFGNCFASAHWI